MKKIVVLGGGGFIGGHLSKRLKEEGNHVRICDIKKHEYFYQDEICDEFILGDLTDPKVVDLVIEEGVDEVYQLAASVSKNDSNLIHNSVTINLNVFKECVNKKVKKVFYSSSDCEENSEYGWEKLFSEKMFLSYHKNYGLNVRIARLHNIFGPQGDWKVDREKLPTAICKKVIESKNKDVIEMWGDEQQTYSFLYVEECVEAVLRLMESDFTEPVNIGSEEMVTINQLAEMAIKSSRKSILIKNIDGEEFKQKYGFKCPLGVRGRNSDNKLYREKMGVEFNRPLEEGVEKTFNWINKQIVG
jgi:nucleoside-diphosphate-sugar epimerase